MLKKAFYHTLCLLTVSSLSYGASSVMAPDDFANGIIRCLDLTGEEIRIAWHLSGDEQVRQTFGFTPGTRIPEGCKREVRSLIDTKKNELTRVCASAVKVIYPRDHNSEVRNQIIDTFSADPSFREAVGWFFEEKLKNEDAARSIISDALEAENCFKAIMNENRWFSFYEKTLRDLLKCASFRVYIGWASSQPRIEAEKVNVITGHIERFLQEGISASDSLPMTRYELDKYNWEPQRRSVVIAYGNRYVCFSSVNYFFRACGLEKP
ncbi:hypothetical protein OAN22_00755 [Alphaproteobacteria bacterium]|nr:hypothetical protein [Alphaproteobacteria bacterium]